MKREPYIDNVKGLAILCITLLHYEDGVFPATVNTFIGLFMITAFYVTSGWVSAMRPSQRTFKEFLKKRWRQLGIPYLWWTGIILAFDLILYAFGYYDLKFIGTEVYKSIVLRGIGTLWFLPAIFGGEIIWFWLKRQRWWYIVLAFILTIGYQYIYREIFNGHSEIIYKIINAPFRTISATLNAWVGIAFGFYMYSLLKNWIKRAKKGEMFIVGATLCVIAYFLSDCYALALSLFRPYLAPLLSPLGALLIFKSMQGGTSLRFFEYWGRNSLNLMVTHYSITMVICHIIVEKWIGMPFYGWVTIICFVLSMAVQYLFVIIIDKYARFTLGK